MAGKTVVVQNAIDFCNRLIDDFKGRKTDRLPPVNKLAKSAGVSVTTMCKAIRFLQDEDRIIAIRGKGILITDDSGDKKQLAAVHRELANNSKSIPAEKWQKVKVQILDDISRGIYSPGDVLPSFKQLQQQYGVCFKTLKKALQTLSMEINLTPYKKTYLVPVHRHPQLATVALLVPDITAEPPHLFLSPRVPEIFRTIEKRCAQSNLDFISIPCVDQERRPLPPDRINLDALERGKVIVGYLLWASGMPSFPELAAYVSRRGKPVSMLDEMGDAIQAIPAGGKGPVKLFPLGSNSMAPLRVAQYLLRLGHSRVVYISHKHNYRWSRIRHAVLSRVFKSVDPGYEVHPITMDSVEDELNLPRMQKEKNVRAKTLLKSLENLGGSLRVSSRESALQMVERNIDELLIERESYQTAIGLFERAMQCNATAWITANDQLALLALDYLGKKGITVPDDLSIIGFDDHELAFIHNITTYNFNVDAIINAAFTNIIHPGRQWAGNRKKIVEIDGTVIERRTTKRAKSRADISPEKAG
ncbi:MAG: GntR family transcriptional regulator [Chitinivibrionales bacterium]|nr:GntR family transcriptional regulator [Chitinivibrionales bacterium]